MWSSRPISSANNEKCPKILLGTLVKLSKFAFGVVVFSRRGTLHCRTVKLAAKNDKIMVTEVPELLTIKCIRHRGQYRGRKPSFLGAILLTPRCQGVLREDQRGNKKFVM